MAANKKRTLIEAITSDEPMLWLQLADGDRLPAHREVLALASRCAKGLPPGDTWDLSPLEIEGKPVSREVAAAWLEAVYRDCPTTYEDGGWGVVPEDRGAAPPAAQLLTFADAVGTSGRAMHACYERVKHQFDEITVGAGEKRLSIPLDGSGYCFGDGSLKYVSLKDRKWAFAPGVSNEDLRQLGERMASQLERMLYMAYRFGLGDLQDKLHRVIFANSQSDAHLLGGGVVKDQILTDRVMAVVGASDLRDTWFEKMTTCAIGEAASLKTSRVTLVHGREPVIHANLELRRPLLGAAAGHCEQVQVDFNDMTVTQPVAEGGLVSYCKLVLCPRRN